MPDLPLQHRFQIVSAPAVEPITVSEAKAHMRIEHSDDDALIARLIDVAVSFVDVRGALGKAIRCLSFVRTGAISFRDQVLRHKQRAAD